jgi:hypothetical protein
MLAWLLMLCLLTAGHTTFPRKLRARVRQSPGAGPKRRHVHPLTSIRTEHRRAWIAIPCTQATAHDVYGFVLLTIR